MLIIQLIIDKPTFRRTKTGKKDYYKCNMIKIFRLKCYFKQ